MRPEGSLQNTPVGLLAIRSQGILPTSREGYADTTLVASLKMFADQHTLALQTKRTFSDGEYADLRRSITM